MFSKKLIISLVLIVASGLAIGTYLVRSNHNEKQLNKKVEASSSQLVLTSQGDWEAGSYSSQLITLSGGNMALSPSGWLD